jgi:hypothetical protein
MRPVDYTREGFAGSAARHLSDDRMFKGKTPSQVVEDYLDTRRDELLFLKSDDFATEHEYRVVLTAGDDDYAFLDFGDALVGVVLGENVPRWQRVGAIEECSKLNVKLGWVQWRNWRPRVMRLWPRIMP